MVDETENAVTRRSILKAGMLSSMSFGARSHLLAGDQGRVDQDGEPRFRIGTCEWSIRMPLKTESFHFGKRNRLQGMQYRGSLILEGSTRQRMSREEGCERNAVYAQTLFNS